MLNTTLQYIGAPLLQLSVDATVKGNQVVKEHTDHKPHNALPGDDSNF